MSAHHKFVWHDLMTTDRKASHRFYTELFGWKTTDDAATAQYVHLKSGDHEIGGMISLDAKQGIPSHWVGYVSVASADEAVKRATAAGAKVHVPAQQIEVGRFAVLGDPQGAVFAPFQYTGAEASSGAAPSAGDKPAPGTFCWDELYTSDPEAAKKFYSQALGWGAEPMEMGEMGTYWLFKNEGQNAGGMMKMMPGVPQPFWLPYVAVTSADKTIADARRLGAEVVVPPTDVPGVGRFAVFVDPQHAALGVLQGT